MLIALYAPGLYLYAFKYYQLILFERIHERRVKALINSDLQFNNMFRYTTSNILLGPLFLGAFSVQII